MSDTEDKRRIEYLFNPGSAHSRDEPPEVADTVGTRQFVCSMHRCCLMISGLEQSPSAPNGAKSVIVIAP
jgi:hypothetical protein